MNISQLKLRSEKFDDDDDNYDDDNDDDDDNNNNNNNNNNFLTLSYTTQRVALVTTRFSALHVPYIKPYCQCYLY